uniref:MADS-box domain-containing protein n=1 Tax=Solanum lycopersicum TaxID=4081 RepID=A0A3Q7IUT3_SOLLC|nr:MADS-box transcription factor 2-like [Solanum lycopersicum]
MGRSKIKVELIQDDKKRMKTLVTRKAGLFKKISELSILCDIKACMLIYDEGNNNNCEMWPNDPNELINLYKNQPFEGPTKRGKTLSGDEIKVEKDPDSRFDYFENNEKKKADAIQVEKYPTWDSRFDYLSQKELQNLAGVLENRMENAKGRIELLKSMNGSCSLSHQQQIWDYNNLMNQTTTLSNNNLFQSNIPISSTVNSMGAGMDYHFCNANYCKMNESENWYGVGSSLTMMQHNMANNGIGSSSTILHLMGDDYGIIDSSSTMMLPMGNNEIGSSSTMQQPMYQYPFMYNGSTHVIGSSSTMQPPMGQYPFTNNDDSTGILVQVQQCSLWGIIMRLVQL